MATTILSGRSLTLTIATVAYSEQILDSAINFDTERLTFNTLAGKAFKYIDSNVTLDLTFLNNALQRTAITGYNNFELSQIIKTSLLNNFKTSEISN